MSLRLLCNSICGVLFTVASVYASEPAKSTILFENVHIFDGKGGALSPPSSVLVEGNLIREIKQGQIEVVGEVLRIDGKGKTLMPGLIDAHTHLMFATIPQIAVLTNDITFTTVAATKAANDMLMRGFTSVRDLGGPVFGLKKGIDMGLTNGPRIWPAGAMISQSGGHGDFRLPTELPALEGQYSFGEKANAAMIADSPDAVRKRAREQLALGASQIKLMAGGGVASNYDPIDVAQYSLPEIRAAVEAADNWGTYVTVHAYTPKAVRQAVEAGVKCIDHGQMLDDDTARLMADNNVWWSLQPFTDDRKSPFPEGSANRLKQLEMYKGTDRAYAMAKKYGIKTAFGTDILFSAQSAAEQGRMLVKMSHWYTSAEVLKMATHDNAELLALSGARSPYVGKLGVVEVGALADLILVNGDPLKQLSLIAEPAINFKVIMKDGKIYKNTL